MTIGALAAPRQLLHQALDHDKEGCVVVASGEALLQAAAGEQMHMCICIYICAFIYVCVHTYITEAKLVGTFR